MKLPPPPPRSDNKKSTWLSKQHVIYDYLRQLEYFSKTFKLIIKTRIRKAVRYETCYLHLWLETACISCFGSAFLTSQLCELIVWYFCADAKGKTEMCFLSYWIKPVLTSISCCSFIIRVDDTYHVHEPLHVSIMTLCENDQFIR